MGLGRGSPRSHPFRGLCRILGREGLTDEDFLFGVGGCSEMHVIFEQGSLSDLKAVEVGIEDELMSWDHLEGTKRHNLTIMVDLMNHNAQPIQLREVFGLHRELLPIEIDSLSGLSAPLDDYLLMLPSEELRHMLSPRNKLTPLRGQFSKLEILRTTITDTLTSRSTSSSENAPPLDN